MAKVNFIDLGLPSGTKWADRNVGAEAPADSGNYLAWGETQPKDSYYLNNYVHYGVVNETEAETEDGSETVNEQKYGYTKYNSVDRKTQLESDDEAGNTPTKEQWEELFANTSMSIADGVATFTAENGNSIQLPIVGCKHETMHCGTWVAEYWTKDLATEENAYRAYFGAEVGATINQQWRIIGMPIRPVSEK